VLLDPLHDGRLRKQVVHGNIEKTLERSAISWTNGLVLDFEAQHIAF
jgi:hypothetical protein